MKGREMAVERIGNTYLVSGDEAKKLERYVFQRTKKEVQKAQKRQLERLEKSEKRRKMWKKKGFLS